MSRWRKWLKRLLWLAGGGIAALLILWGVMLALMYHWVAKPPVLTETPAIVSLTPEKRGDRVYLGANWFGQRDGLPVLYLTGTPFEMGYANGVLTQKLIHRQEDSVVALVNHVAPYRWMQFTLEFFVTYKNRHMTENITPDLQMEMLGIARGCPDAHPEMGPYYNRILNYHGAQDISYMLMNSPLIRRGCTAFGAWGAATTESHLLCGRNFDWEADPVFDEDRIVIICEPTNGIPFISLAWAGMAGCVSGMNREGVSIIVNGAPSHLPADSATPTCLVAREVLEHAHNLAEATDDHPQTAGVRLRDVSGRQPRGWKIHRGRENAGENGGARAGEQCGLARLRQSLSHGGIEGRPDQRNLQTRRHLGFALRPDDGTAARRNQPPGCGGLRGDFARPAAARRRSLPATAIAVR